MSFYTGAKKFVTVVLKPFFRLTVEGKENVPADRGFILACNHVSDLDPVLLGVAFPRAIRYMAKEELFHIPVLGFLIRKLGAFPVARGKGDIGAINNAVEIVKEGGILGIFPEGGRSKDRKFHKVKSGTAVIAGQTGADILPAAILYGKRHFLRREVTVKFGKMIPNGELNVSGRTKSELKAANALLGGRIAELLGVEAP